MPEDIQVLDGHMSESLLEEEMRNSYLRYSMSVIVSRALPDVRDGLKPVHRRILITMNDLSLSHRAKFKKCAKVVGDCMGNYHPHGDSAIYDSLVRMAQPWSMRYMLVDGHGNFGSIDGDPAAAYRYTECRMQRLSEEMLQDLEKNTVDYMQTYDQENEEPTVLPAKLPNLLVNGATGIAVGMATNMPPHNLKEICTALVKICDDPEVEEKELLKIVKGPDFPTGGLICGRAGIRKAYESGRGKITVRARCHIETLKNDRQRIVVTEIPYQVTKERILEQIAREVKNENIEGIQSVHDYTGRDGINVTIELKRGEDADVALNQLYKRTQLQDTYSIINIALVDNKPVTLTLKEMLYHFRDHRFEVIRRRTLFELQKAEARAHIVEGLLKAIDNIDEIIRIIRESDDVATAKQNIMDGFELSDVQAQAILDMPLRRLTGLERKALEDEFADLQEKIAQYKAILADPQLVYDIIREDAYEMMDRYGDERRTEIVSAAEDITIEDLIAEEEMAVCISHGGYIKRLPLDTYRKQGRGGKGIVGAKMKDDDFLEHLFIAGTHDYILFFTNRGQVHWLKVYDIPQMGRSARGRALANVLQLEKKEYITSMIPVREFEEDRYLVMGTRRGVVKKTALSAFSRPMKGGIKAINLDEDDSLIGVVMTNGEQSLMMATRRGRACYFEEADVRAMGRPARGVAGVKLRDEDEVVSLLCETPNTSVLTVTELGYGKRTDFEDYRKTKRGAQGVINLKRGKKTGDVVSVMSVTTDDEVMCMTRNGMVIRTPTDGIRVIGRATQGVRVVRLNENDEVVAVARVLGGKEEDEEDDERVVSPQDADADEPVPEDEDLDADDADDDDIDDDENDDMDDEED